MVESPAHKGSMTAKGHLLRTGAVLFKSALIVLMPLVFHGGSVTSAAKRSITVADGIGMTRLADPGYFIRGRSEGRVAEFSPSGKKFAVVLRKGNLDKNVNEFSILLFQTAGAFRSPRPDCLVTFSSSSNRDAIHDLKWLADDETIAFLGEKPGEISQIYALNVDTRHLEKLTNHSTPVTSYDISPDGREIIFVADPPVKKIMDAAETRRNGILITSQYLPDILQGDSARSPQSELYLLKRGQPRLRLPVADTIYEGTPMSLAPGDRYALIGGYVRDIPTTWARYKGNALLHKFVVAKRRSGVTTPLQRYLLVDTKDDSVRPLLNTPMLGLNPFRWAPDGHSIYIEGTYLPLDISDPSEQAEREKKTYDVEVSLPTNEYRQVRKADWPKEPSVSPPLEVTLREDVNTSPKIYVSESQTKRSALLLDLNPGFGELSLGTVKTIEWNVDGVEVIGGLYLPPDFVPGRRYPLVIQTHGFNPTQFSIDGRSEWSSGFAARPLASHGIVVLQTFAFENQEEQDRERIRRDEKLGLTAEESVRNLSVIVYERAIDYLSGQGIIDRNRVGIVGFSRTVCFVAYTLTHSKYRFAAASLVDGIDCGYFQYMAFPESAQDISELNGGAAPFGDGLQKWLRESPGFNLDKVRTPVRLVALGPSAVLEAWEWFAGLDLQGKPVELIEIPGASHLIEKPWERRTAQQGMVDWFRFWLKNEEDPAPEKRDQYIRWRELKDRSRIENSITSGAQADRGF